MELELHRLDLRYQALRRRSARKERSVLASLAQIGQQAPVVVLGAEGERPVLLDGYKRVRALERLGRDVVQATAWNLSEAEALLLERLMRSAEAESALEQGWLVRELCERLGPREGIGEGEVRQRTASTLFRFDPGLLSENGPQARRAARAAVRAGRSPPQGVWGL